MAHIHTTLNTTQHKHNIATTLNTHTINTPCAHTTPHVAHQYTMHLRMHTTITTTHVCAHTLDTNTYNHTWTATHHETHNNISHNTITQTTPSCITAHTNHTRQITCTAYYQPPTVIRQSPHTTCQCHNMIGSTRVVTQPHINTHIQQHNNTYTLAHKYLHYELIWINQLSHNNTYNHTHTPQQQHTHIVHI